MENTVKTPLEKQNKIQTVPIEMLIDNPNNPNRMSKSSFAKLVRNIEQTGLYEPIIVRNRNKGDTKYEIINGHHRLKALKMLGYKTVDVCVWNVDDMQSDILLVTLNNLRGTAVLEKKLALLNGLSKQ
jgi:ParB family chromosome partitioning protein